MERLAVARSVVSGTIPPIRSSDPAQRPTALFYPGLLSKRFYDPDAFPWVAGLRSAFPSISAELRHNLRMRRGFETIFPAYSDAGKWAGLWFHFYGQRDDANCEAFPKTMEAIQKIPRMAGWACYSALAPDSHVKAHCGATNAKLRLHFSIRADEGSRMRVVDEVYEWRQGDIMIFDDSYEHEVWVAGRSPRIVLIVDFYHPDLSDEEVEFLTEFERTPSPLLRNESLRSGYAKTAAKFASDSRATSAEWVYDLEESEFADDDVLTTVPAQAT
jgi:hypothetical protein